MKMPFIRQKEPPPFVSAVVVAAGFGSRMAGVDKLLFPLHELPLIVRTLAAFEECPAIAETVLVCREEALPDYFALVQDFGLDKVSSVVSGGAHRQNSVFAGIEACSGRAKYYAVHDGARPLVDPMLIENCVKAAFTCGAATAGVTVRDHIGRRDSSGFLAPAPGRAEMVSLQTPQVFEASIYRRAMALARQNNRRYPDDCRMVEATGQKVYISWGNYENIRITTPEDLAIADAVLTWREEGLSQWLQSE